MPVDRRPAPLSSALAQRVVDLVAPTINHNINVMDEHGTIIAGLEPARIGTLHRGAQRVVAERRSVLVTVPEPGTLDRPGANEPLMIDGELCGVVGVTGDPQEVGPLGIDVIIVEPGYFRTDFLGASSLSTEGTVSDDYAETAGDIRQHAADVNQAQPGDPVKAAAAIVDIASAERPPLRIQLGRDSFAAVANKLESVAEEQRAWRELATSTDHDDIAVS